MLADRWAAESARRCQVLSRVDRAATASWSRRVLARADTAAVQRIDGCDEKARRELVAAAAQALEACAATWQAFGPVAGARQLHLVRRLEQRLAEHEQDVLAAEAGYRLDRQTVAAPATAAREAIERLHGGPGEAASALAALEEGVVAFAAAAIRAVENIDASGRANGHGGRELPPHPAGLRARFTEIDAHAAALIDPRQPSDLATWLSECLVITTPAIAATTEACTEGRPRTDDKLRRGWLRLGAREFLIAHELPQSAAARPGPGFSRAVCGAAAYILADTGLAGRVASFDPQLAWERQAAALSPLIPGCAQALGGDSDAAQRVHDILLDRLARVVAVLWLIDHQSRPPRTDAENGPGNRTR